MQRSSAREQRSAPLDATQDFVITNSVVGEMPGIYQPSNVAFGFAPSLTQITYRSAVVDVINDQLPALALPDTDRVGGENRGGKKRFVVAGSRWIAQVGRSAG